MKHVHDANITDILELHSELTKVEIESCIEASRNDAENAIKSACAEYLRRDIDTDRYADILVNGLCLNFKTLEFENENGNKSVELAKLDCFDSQTHEVSW